MRLGAVKPWGTGLIRIAVIAAMALIPAGGEVFGGWASAFTYYSLTYVADAPFIILASWGVGASIRLSVLVASVSALAALMLGDEGIRSLRSAAGMIAVTAAVLAMFAVLTAALVLPVIGIGEAYTLAAISHIAILAVTVPLAATTAVLGGVRGLSDVAVACVAGVLSLFISSLLGSFLVRAAGGDYYVLSVVGIIGPSITVVGLR